MSQIWVRVRDQAAIVTCQKSRLFPFLKLFFIYLLTILLFSVVSLVSVVSVRSFPFGGSFGDGQNTDPQSMDYSNGLPKWTTLKWTTPKNNFPNEYYLMFLAA